MCMGILLAMQLIMEIVEGFFLPRIDLIRAKNMPDFYVLFKRENSSDFLFVVALTDFGDSYSKQLAKITHRAGVHSVC